MITMYGADWCGDFRRASAYFTDNNIPFDYVNAEDVPEAADIILERNGGIQRIPVIVFDDDSHLTEPTNAEIETKLADLANGDSYVVSKDIKGGRFELHRNGELLSFADFSEQANVVTVPHVMTLPAHRHQGHAARLMDGVLRHIRMSRGHIVARCPFAARHIEDNARWQDLVADAA